MYFKTYTHKFVIKDNRLVTRQFIVLKHDDGSLQFTDFHRYVDSPRNRVQKYTNDGNTRFNFTVKFLNYAYFHAGIHKLNDISVEIVDDFLNAYGMCELPEDDEHTHRTKETVTRCVNSTMDFLELFIDQNSKSCRIKKDDLYTYVNRRDKRGKVNRVKVPRFKVTYTGNHKPIYRDIPDKAFNMLFHHISLNHPEILGLVMLSAFGGLRPSEACNVRREDSPLGAGILFDIVGGELNRVEINLRAELNIRSDMLVVGKIKKERKQQIPDIFLKAFQESYNMYLQYMEGQKYEQDYAAFTVNKQGRAMTYASYRKKFQSIIRDEMVPIFLASDDPEIALYGRILMENQLSPHVFRHWYTVQLVLSGISDPGTLMYWRGDTSPESSLTYLKNKGELAKQYKKVNNEMFDYLLWTAKKKYD